MCLFLNFIRKFVYQTELREKMEKQRTNVEGLVITKVTRNGKKRIFSWKTQEVWKIKRKIRVYKSKDVDLGKYYVTCKQVV